MSVLFALASALSNAIAAVSQRLANVSSPPETRGWVRQALYLVRQPIWLTGSGFLVLTFVFGALALNFGQLAVVQPIVVTELIFTLALRRYLLRDTINAKSWGAALLLCVGLAGFLIVADPSPGSRHVAPLAWIVVLVVAGSITAALALLSRRGSEVWRATALGCAAGIVWSIDAGFVKSTTDNLAQNGWSGVFEHWSVYALVLTGLLGEFLVQSALHVGPLSASQPAMLVVEPLAGIFLGLALFGEHLNHTPAAIIGSVLALAVMALGVILVSVWSPPPMAPRTDLVVGNAPAG
jgi:drug/metabolite transporter (DMT)-like permease